MCSLLCVCTREVEVGVRGQRGGGRGRRMSSLIFAEEDNTFYRSIVICCTMISSQF